jgi:predicted flap endonuclease-1-like 5' DNA nuclease
MGYTLATTWLLLAIAAIIGFIIGWFLAKKLCRCDDSALRAELNTAKIEANEHKARAQGLVGQVESLKAEASKLRTSGGDVLKHTQRIDELEAAAVGAAVAAAAATLAAKTQHDGEINAFKAELTAATAKHAEAEAKIQGFAATGSAAGASVSTTADDSVKLSARIAELEAENAKAVASVTAASDDSVKLSARIAELEAENAKAVAESSAAVKAAASQASGESAKLAARVAELEAEQAKGLAASAVAATAAAGAATVSSSKHSEEIAALKAQLAACEAKNAEAQTTIQGLVAASAGTPSISAERLTAGAEILGLANLGMDDLKVVEGIGPKIDELLVAEGITTWRQLSTMPVEKLQAILDAAGPNFSGADPGSWARQAGLLADGRWAEFKTLTNELKAGRAQ